MATETDIATEDRPKVYLETSFMFYLTGRETTDQKIASEQAYTRKWWEVERPRCRVFTSSFVIQESNGRDPEYVATAAVHGMDYLLSWNCRHLANPQTYPKTKKIVESFGLICPSIITPRSYLEDFTNAR